VVLAAATMTALLGFGTPAFATFPGHVRSVIPPLHRCLDVDMDTAGNVRTNVQLYDCRWLGDPLLAYQVFDQQSIPGVPYTVFKLRNQATQKCLSYNVGGGRGSPVWAESCNRDGQGWVLVHVDGGVTYVAIETDYLCLDAVDFRGGNRTGIDLWSCNSSFNTIIWEE